MFLENLQLTKKSGHVLAKGQQCFLKHRLVVFYRPPVTFKVYPCTEVNILGSFYQFCYA